MKTKMLTIGLFVFGMLGCADESSDSSLNGTWTVYSFENIKDGTIEFKTQENSWSKDIRIQFDDTKSPQQISGTNILNEIAGDFDYVGQSQFKVSNLMSTYVNQPRWADQFITAITDRNLTFKIQNNNLVIYYSNMTKSVTLKRNE